MLDKNMCIPITRTYTSSPRQPLQHLFIMYRKYQRAPDAQAPQAMHLIMRARVKRHTELSRCINVRKDHVRKCPLSTARWTLCTPQGCNSRFLRRRGWSRGGSQTFCRTEEMSQRESQSWRESSHGATEAGEGMAALPSPECAYGLPEWQRRRGCLQQCSRGLKTSCGSCS